METINRSVLDLKPIMDRYQRIDLSAYQRLGEFMKIKAVKIRGIIRCAGEVENESRIILAGLVGAYKEGKLVRLFFPEEICMDSVSYFEYAESRIELKALEDTIFTALSREAAEQILSSIPEFQKISPTLIAMAKSSNENWLALTQMPWRDLLYYLKSKYPGVESLVSQKDLADLIHIDPKTLQRRNQRAYAKARANRLFKLLASQLKYPFKSQVHEQADEIQKEAEDWGRYLQGFLNETIYRQKFKKLNLAGLSTRLYPEASYDNSVWICKLYLPLFTIDDLCDQLSGKLKVDFWSKIDQGFKKVLQGANDPEVYGLRLLGLNHAFRELFADFQSLKQVDDEYLDLFVQEMLAYLQANLWEAENRSLENIPSIEDYLEKRPVFSGGNLSIFLSALSINLKFSEISAEWQKLENYRRLASGLIFISNDLISYLKEKNNGDFHNWMRLLMHHRGNDSR